MATFKLQVHVTTDYDKYSDTIRKLIDAIISGYEVVEQWKGMYGVLAVTKDAIISITNAYRFSHYATQQIAPHAFIEYIYVTILTSDNLLYDYVAKLIKILRNIAPLILLTDISLVGGEYGKLQ